MVVNYFEKYGFSPIACRVAPGNDPVRGAAHTAVVAGRRCVTETPDAGDQREEALRELSSLLAVTRMRTEALLAEGKDADAGVRVEALESVRSSVMRARDLLGRLQSAVAPAAPSDASGARLRVLVIDDDPLILDTMASLLRSAGHELEPAAGGEDGVAAYRHRPFDCVITDARMKGIGGPIVCRTIKDGDPGAYVVLLTGVELDPEELRAAGVDRVLAKPARRALILEAVWRTAS
jgi:CheY-like chemotaxis protein